LWTVRYNLLVMVSSFSIEFSKTTPEGTDTDDIILNYYMAMQIRAFWLVRSWSGFRHTDRFRGNGRKLCIFCFRKLANSKQSMVRVPYNKLRTNLASSSRTGNIGPRSFLYWPRCARSVLPRSRANIPQYGPRARLVRVNILVNDHGG